MTRPPATGHPERVLAAAATRVPRRGPLVVALSGGPDSAVAAWVCHRLRPDGGCSAAFVDHGWPASGEMAEAAAAVAAALGLPLTVITAGPTAGEGQARVARLAALEALATGGGDTVTVITGHHADDQVETVLIHLLRGAGSTGLSGIPVDRPPFLRPLLGIAGEDVRKAAEELELPFADDPANRDRRHLRNRVRHDVVPALEAVQPAVRDVLIRTASILAVDDAALEAAAARVPVTVESGTALVPWGPLQTLPEAVSARVVRRALRAVHPPYAGDASDVAAVRSVSRGVTVQLGSGLRCERDGGRVAIYDPADLPAPPDPRPLPVPGRVDLAGVAVTARYGRRSPAEHWSPRTALVSGELAGDLTVRPAEPGERIDAGVGRKPVRHAMAEAGIAPRLREGWPVVTAHGKIAWLVGARVASWAAASPPVRGVRLVMERR